MNLLKRLNHPNIVKIIGNHQQNDDLYLILESAFHVVFTILLTLAKGMRRMVRC